MTMVAADINIPWPVPDEEQSSGNFRCLNNTLLCRFMEDPWGGKEGSLIIRPDTFDDSRYLSMVVKVLARGPGYKIKRRTRKNWAAGSKQWKWITEDLPAAKPNPYYVGDIAVNEYYYLKMPWVKDNKVWVRGLRETHPEDAERIEYLDKLEAVKSSPLAPTTNTGFSLIMPSNDEMAQYGGKVIEKEVSFKNITSSTRHVRHVFDEELGEEVIEHRLFAVEAHYCIMRMELEEHEDESAFKQIYRGDQLSAM